MLRTLRPVDPVVQTLSFLRSEYDPLSMEDALIVFEGKLMDGSKLEIEIVYPKSKGTDFYIRIDDKDLLYGPNSEMQAFCMTGSMKKFIEFKLEEYEEERKGNKKKEKNPKKKSDKSKKYKRK